MALIVASQGCKKLTDHFDIEKFAENVNENSEVCSAVNEAVGCPEEDTNVAPLLKVDV